MRNVQNQTAATKANAAAAPEVGVTVTAAAAAAAAAEDYNNDGTDNIITISTASITEAHSIDEDTDQIKSLNDHQQSKKLVQFSSHSQHRPIAAQAHTVLSPTNSRATPTAAAVAKQKLRALCNFSNWISFQDNIADVHHRKGRRLHGLQLPLHPLQLFGWLVLVLFGLATYCVLIPSFNAILQGPLYGLITGLYIVHIVSHVTALLCDPADRELRRIHRNDRIVPEFDRSKHTHVIENGRCHLCNIRTTSPRTKHCSVCNKCVGKFDHHCKWLNHCVGSRNYVAFLMCVVSAVIATLVIVAAVIGQIVLYYVQPEWLSFYWTGIGTGAGFGDKNLSTRTEVELAAAGGSNVYANASDFINLTLSGSNGTLLLLQEEDEDDGGALVDSIGSGIVNGTLPTLLENITALIGEDIDNLTTTMMTSAPTGPPKLPPTVASSQYNGTTTATAADGAAGIAGISVNDTIFLILIGVLGLLAAITAGLLLHLCFFHIYISFLGLTTYEYIRNHRQLQEAKAKQLQAASELPATLANTNSTLPKNGAVHFSHDPSQQKKTSKATNKSGQIYCCASLQHPNNPVLEEAGYFKTARGKSANDAGRTVDDDEELGQLGLHCCANSREYHRRATKTYYMCTLLEERDAAPTALASLAQLSAGNGGAGIGPYDSFVRETADESATTYKTFHCCSRFAATTSQRRVSAASTKATLVSSDLEAAAATLSASRTRAYLQYTEQCTFCTFRLRSPVAISKRTSATSTRTIASQPSSGGHHHQRAASVVGATGLGSTTGSAEHQRCCMKSISKHQRWRRKWNCCTSVPDSPDVPHDIIAALAFRGTGGANKINASDLPVQFIKTANGGADGGLPVSCVTSPRLGSLKCGVDSNNAATDAHNTRTWPVARLRHMMRMLSRYRRPRCRHNAAQQPALNVHADQLQQQQQYQNLPQFQIKPNQIRPLQLQQRTGYGYGNANGHGHGHGNGCQTMPTTMTHAYSYDSSSPQPSSLTPTTVSDMSSEHSSLYSDTSSSNVPTPQAIETILPTSVIRDDTSMTYHHHGLQIPPALPPPTRRRIPNPTDLEDLAETLGFASHPSNCSSNSGGGGGSSSTSSSQQQHRLPALNNVYRRHRRKHFLRTRSPTLSPIHESGLSNPTSPQPLRHHLTSANGNSLDNCTPRASNETLRKVASNSSLHSLSSNSSSP